MQVRFVGDLVRAFRVQSSTIAGSSRGGCVAWRSAASDRDRVRALVLGDAAGWPNATQARPPLASQRLTSPAGRFLLKTIETRPITSVVLKADSVEEALVTLALVDHWVDLLHAPGHRPNLGVRLMASGGQERAPSLAK